MRAQSASASWHMLLSTVFPQHSLCCRDYRHNFVHVIHVSLIYCCTPDSPLDHHQAQSQNAAYACVPHPKWASALYVMWTLHCSWHGCVRQQFSQLPLQALTSPCWSLLQVARVGVHSGHLLELQQLSKTWLLGQCTQQQVDVSHINRLIQLLMEHLQRLPDGQHLLTHQPGADAVCCYTAVKEQNESGMVSFHFLDKVLTQTLIFKHAMSLKDCFVQSGTTWNLTCQQHARPCDYTTGFVYAMVDNCRSFANCCGTWLHCCYCAPSYGIKFTV